MTLYPSERRSGGDVAVVVEWDTKKILGGNSNTPFVCNDTHTLTHSHCSIVPSIPSVFICGVTKTWLSDKDIPFHDPELRACLSLALALLQAPSHFHAPPLLAPEDLQIHIASRFGDLDNFEGVRTHFQRCLGPALKMDTVRLECCLLLSLCVYLCFRLHYQPSL